MNKPSLNTDQWKVLKSMAKVWDQIDHMPDRVESKKLANKEVQNLLHVVPAINLLRIVADHVNQAKEK